MNNRRAWRKIAGTALTLTLAAAASACGSSAGGSDSTEAIEFKFATYIGPTASEMQAMEWFASELKERSDGKYTIKPFYSESLLKSTDVIPGVSQGRADMGFTNPSGYHPAELSLTSVNELPLQAINPAAHAGALQQLYAENDAFKAQYEKQGVHVLYFAPNGESIVGSEGPIENVEQLAEQKLRAIGQTANALQAAGVDVVSLPSSEIYQSLDQGLLDGFTTFPFATVEAMSLHEVIGHMTDIGTGNYGVGAVVIGANRWENLPKDAQQLLTELSDEAMGKTLETLVAAQDHACATMREAGVKMNAWASGEVDRLRESTKATEMAESWAAEQEAKDLPGNDVLSQFRSSYDEIAQENPYIPAVERCIDS